MSMPAAAADARATALAGLVDYAGVFPPARLPLDAALAEYRRIRASEHAWFVNAFIAPAGELAGPPSQELAGLPLSIVVDGDLPALPAGLDVAMLEFKTGVPGGHLPARAVVEVDWRDPAAMRARLAELAADGRGLGAKLRCGGLAADMFPPPAAVAGFMLHCRELRLAYKLTAGLHQPFRHVDEATGFTHHGFVNMLAAEVLGRAHGLGAAAVAGIVADEDPASFGLDAAALRWRGLAAGPVEIAAARRDGFLGFGSCDVEEPLAALAARGLL